MVHQHFMLIPVFTVTENVMLGHEQTNLGFLASAGPPARSPRSRAATASTCRPMRSSADLPVGVQQRVEILKALSRDAKLLVLDEPTAVLTPQETEELITVMRVAARRRHVHRLHQPQAARGARRSPTRSR